MILSKKTFPTIRQLSLGTLAATTLLSGAVPVRADVPQNEINKLNPRQQEYNRCPTDSDCYVLSTRIISGQVRDPSETGGDENYILPIWSIIDGMGVDVHPLATESDDFFRVNISKKTIGNMGSIFNSRRTGRTVDLRRERPDAYRLHTNRDFVVPMSRDRWTSEGLIFSVNMMEHDQSRRSDIDREYLKSARRVHAGLLRNAQNVRVSMQSPTYYSDAAAATWEFTKKAAPMAAAAYTAYQTGGVAGAAGAVDISSSANLFKNLWSGIKRLDRDDVGQQKTIFIPFRNLQNGREKVHKICGTTDPNAFNTGKFCIQIGVKLDLHSRKRTASAFEQPQTRNNSNHQLSGTWKANDGGTYKITQSGNRINWIGRGRDFINRFNGTINDNIVTGYWQDTAESQTQNRGTIKLRIEGSGRLRRIEYTGPFTGSNWVKAVPQLAGTWKANDGGTYQITQSGNRINWIGRGRNFINRFNGTIAGNTITGSWRDTAESQTQNRGTLKLKINNAGHFIRINQTGGFTGSTWQRANKKNGANRVKFTPKDYSKVLKLIR